MIFPEADSFFAITYFFCNHFEELQTVLLEVELIINNASLTYAYLNTIKTCLTPNYLLFGRQLLCSSNSTSTVKSVSKKLAVGTFLFVTPCVFMLCK